MEFERPRLSSWYLNTNRLAALLGEPISPAAQVSILQNSDQRTEAMRRAGALAAGVLASGKVPNLTRAALRETLDGTSVFASLWGVFTMSGVHRAFDRERRGLRYEPGMIRGRIPLGGAEFEMKGMLFNEHFYSNSSTYVLSGKRRLLVAAQFTFDGDQVEMYPYVVGDLVTHDFLTIPWASQVRVYPSAIDAFSKSSTVSSPTPIQLALVRGMSEEAVKIAIAEIIGEPFVPKDWGGEKSDLTTSRLTVGGRPISAAFIFKGPGMRGEMHPANMGKRGDQLVRAFDEPVDLVVVQHHDKIANTVVRLAEALASDPGRPRRYCIMDGADTYRLLKAYGKLPTA